MNWGTKGLCSLLGAAGLVVALTGTAHASYPTVVWLPGPDSDNSDAGEVYFSADPGDFSRSPGDAIQACDWKPDGKGVEATLIANDVVRKVSTRGHKSPYCTPWPEGSGDIREDIPASVKGCLVKGDVTYVCHTSAGET